MNAVADRTPIRTELVESVLHPGWHTVICYGVALGMVARSGDAWKIMVDGLEVRERMASQRDAVIEIILRRAEAGK